MDYLELFDRQGRIMDDLMLPAVQVSQEDYAAKGAVGGPSLRDLLVEWLELQRRTVHLTLLGRPYRPLPAAQTATVMELARAFGGFRMTLRDTIEDLEGKGLSRKVAWTAPDGERMFSVDDVLTHLALHGARLTGLVAERLRQLDIAVPPVDLLDRKPRKLHKPSPEEE